MMTEYYLKKDGRDLTNLSITWRYCILIDGVLIKGYLYRFNIVYTISKEKN